MVSPAGRARLELPLGGLGHQAGLDDRRRKQDPAQVGGTARVVERGRETTEGVAVGEIQADRGALGDDGLAVDEDRQLAHGVEGEDLGSLVGARHHVDEAQLIVDPELLEHPECARGTGEGVMVEHEGHSLCRYAIPPALTSTASLPSSHPSPQFGDQVTVDR